MENGKRYPNSHKKDKYIVSNYRPVSLLPICGKIFEKVIFDNLYKHIYSNNLISDKQSGYRKGDSTIKQLLSITHEIYKAFDASPSKEVRAIFLDISRAFDRVWHEGLIFKLKQFGLEGEMINIISSFLSQRKQRVAIDGKVSSWVDIEAGVPQGSILGPILFLVYINDLTTCVDSDIRIFADNTFIFRIVDQNVTQKLKEDLDKITKWANKWKMVFNPDITKQAVKVTFSAKRDPSTFEPLYFNGIPVKQANETKHPDYGDIIYDVADLNKTSVFTNTPSNAKMEKIESIQYQAALIVTGAWKGSSRKKIYDDLGWECLQDRRSGRKLSLLYEIQSTNLPVYLNNILRDCRYNENSRNSNRLLLKNFPCNSNRFKSSCIPSVIRDWNLLGHDIKSAVSKNAFKNKMLKITRPTGKSYFRLLNKDKSRFITLLRMGLSPLRAHKFRYNSGHIRPFLHRLRINRGHSSFSFSLHIIQINQN